MDVKTPEISVVVVSFNSCEELGKCLGALPEAANGVSLEVLLIDNASTDNSADLVLKEFPSVKLIKNPINLGFAAAVNQAARIATSRYLVLLNPDSVLSPGTLRMAIRKMEQHPKAGMGGGLLVSPKGEPQPSARLFPSALNQVLTHSGLAWKYPHSRFFGRADRTWAPIEKDAQVDWVPGAFAIIRKEVFDRMQGFDERFFLYAEEVDLCRRMKQAGYEVWYWPEIRVVHEGGASARSLPGHFSEQGAQLTLWSLRSRFLYFRKHHGLWAAYLIKTLGTCWYQMRSAVRSSDPEKRKESLEQIALFNKAWEDTQGGTVCPKKPWR